jgi:hypothetical protein
VAGSGSQQPEASPAQLKLEYYSGMKLIALLLILSFPAFAATKRSAKARYQFRKSHPCPATGKTRGACKGYVIDHRVALCAGGKDEPENMQWQTVADAKAKDKWECRPYGDDGDITPTPSSIIYIGPPRK